MSMDALTSAALENLHKDAMPKLVQILEHLHLTSPSDRIASEDITTVIRESYELLQILSRWSDLQAPLTEDAISDEEARRLLSEMDAPVVSQKADTQDMSDDEAQMILAEMDAPIQNQPSGSDTMTDEAASKLLAEMDAPSSPEKPIQAKSTNTSTSATTAAPAPTTAITTVDHNAAIAEIPEIPEWETNEFASDPEMMNDFTSNSAEIMQTLDDTVLRLEQDPTNKETIEEIFRAAHTLKGAAGMFGFRSIERVMHRMENLFDNVRKGKLVPNADTIDAVFQGLDCLKKLLAAVLAQTPSGMKTAPIVYALERAAAGNPISSHRSSGNKPTATEQVKTSDDSHHESPDESSKTTPSTHQQAPSNAKRSEGQGTIRVDLERLDALVNLIGELVTDRTRFVTIEDSMRMQTPNQKLIGPMTETLQQFGRHMNEIQDIIMKVRMVPVGSVFNKYPRIVRDLARQLGKQIDLIIEGEATEFDKTLVEQIADPLVHLIRNACDHGIETPDVRQNGGKSPNGRVTLSARQEGNQIIIEIKDDGKGMDVARIRSKGIEKGLITADQALSDRDIFNLIFEPGFSTAEKVTTVSGRGVGMDVVKKQIAKLKGMVEINSALGKGSTITIQLPLTLAIMQSLLVGVNEEILAIPLSSVIESIRIKPQEIQTVGNTPVIKLRDDVLPLLYLDEILHLNQKDAEYWYRHPELDTPSSAITKQRNRRTERLYVVVVGTAERRFGLVVDTLLNQQEMVIKPLGSLLRGTPCVAGGAVLGSGEVVLVMDITEIESLHRRQQRTLATA